MAINLDIQMGVSHSTSNSNTKQIKTKEGSSFAQMYVGSTVGVDSFSQ